MKRSGAVKFPQSVQLFKFCQKVLSHQRGSKIHDQEVGSILEFNPSDCSHWKRGEKSVRSVFALAKLAETLGVEASLIHDVASGNADLEEAFFEYLESKAFRQTVSAAQGTGGESVQNARARVEVFVNRLHEQSEFQTPPFYLPEVLRSFAFITSQPAEMLDKLSRILRVKPGQYCIQFRKGDLKAQTRMSMAKDLARIIFEAERARFPELGKVEASMVAFEEMVFIANLMAPKNMIIDEMAKLDSRRNVVADLAALFWVPKSLIGFQLQEVLRAGQKLTGRIVTPSERTNVDLSPKL